MALKKDELLSAIVRDGKGGQGGRGGLSARGSLSLWANWCMLHWREKTGPGRNEWCQEHVRMLGGKTVPLAAGHPLYFVPVLRL